MRDDMITLEHLTLRIGARTILDDISFDVAEGEAVALVGPNGSGKTSILRCLLGLMPFEGRASIGGFDVVEEPIRARENSGYLPQRPAFGNARAQEVLTFIAKLRGIERRRVGEVLREVGLEDHAAEPAACFSGGMQQRLSLAAVLLTGAPVLLLDEPTASLDREGQAAFLEIATLLRRKGRTLLLSSHRPEEVSLLADRILHLERGQLVEIERVGGEPGKVLSIARGGVR